MQGVGGSSPLIFTNNNKKHICRPRQMCFFVVGNVYRRLLDRIGNVMLYYIRTRLYIMFFQRRYRMQRKRFKPLIDKMFWIISIPLCVLMTAFTVFATILQPSMLFFMLTVDAFVAYFLISPLWGYVELREHTVFIKYGLSDICFIKRLCPSM